MQIPDLYTIFLQHPSVRTDTRKLQNGDLFFALKGPNFNGNLFAKQAIEMGASYVIADEETGETDKRIIRVNDALKTLQDLAKHHRSRFLQSATGQQVPFIAI